MPKVGVILSGCGVQDGSEIHEAVLTLLALDRAGADVVMMAPDKPQADVVDHKTGKATAEKRNVLAESARIARGKIVDVASVKADQLDAVILPGGFGAAKNLCTFAKDGADCRVEESVTKLLREMHAKGKPIGALCIAPTILAKVFGRDVQPELTVGSDATTAQAIEAMGARHYEAKVTDVVIDAENRIATTPAYMLADRIRDVATGADKLVQAVLRMTAERIAAR
jgi:enhancing lycopene biosynthesis protein 2